MRQCAQDQQGGDGGGSFEYQLRTQPEAQRQRIVDRRDVVDRLEVGDIDYEEYASQPGENQLSRVPPDGAGEQQGCERVDGDRKQVEGSRVVAANQEHEVFDGFGDGAARGLGFVGGEEEGPVLLDLQVIAERVGVVGVEQVGVQIAEAQRGNQAQAQCVGRPDGAREIHSPRMSRLSR